VISDKFDRNENPDWEPDALVEVTFSGRKTIALNGYRLTDDYFLVINLIILFSLFLLVSKLT